ncbi:MAG TPA: ATP-binding protein [Hymenobacter sp.]|uniref:ATP-binding protein n=1 Tax=Hymenobacter sp. TaxID=1898978 RepID=UPI002D7F9B81|nr:ATP-binding protein [Hymenobacter sp.]HET9503136.1 ATP-binding protein [Hymenobacter sp.]
MLVVLLLGGVCFSGAAQAPAEPAFSLACQPGARVGRDKQQVCEIRDLTMPAPVGQALLIEGGNGGTTIHGWAGPDIRIKALVQCGGRTQEEAQARVQAISIVAAGNVLRAILPEGSLERMVRYELFVPRQTALVVTSGNGSIRIDNVQANIEFHNQNGDVTLRDLGGRVAGETVNGSLSLALGGSAWVGEGLDVRTTNGGVRWQVPAGYSARLLLSTQAGSLPKGWLAVPVGRRKEASGSLGQGGGPLLKAATVNGSISLMQNGETPAPNPGSTSSLNVQHLKSALEQAGKRPDNPPAPPDTLLAQARRLAYVPGQAVALSQLAAARLPQAPGPAAALVQDAAQLAASLRDAAEAGWALGQVGQLQARLARQSAGLSDFYAPLLQALSTALGAARPQNQPAKEPEASAPTERRALRSLAALPPPALPGAPTSVYGLPRITLADKWLDTLLTDRRSSPQVVRQLAARRQLRDKTQALSAAFAQQGDYARAYQYNLQYNAYKDSLTAEATTRRLAALEYRQNLSKKEARIQYLTKEQQIRQQAARRQKLLVIILNAVVGMLAMGAFLLYRSSRAQRRANAALEEQKNALQATLADLKTAQSQLIQSEKMASLGELTAGIAHEIQNPLNFVNNFSEVSTELLDELLEQRRQPTPDLALEDELLADVHQNLLRINQHGRRASAIVKGMLEHARTSTGQKAPTDVNALLEEYGKLAYHSARAKDKAFEAKLLLHLDPGLGPVPAVPQDLSRVLLNVFTNAFYAVQQKARIAGPAYHPEVQVRTQREVGQVKIQIRDNGPGIPEAIRQKVLQPFFTTKPTGEGTGLGLSLSHDIITKGHGGTFALDSEEGEFTELTLTLPVAG